ncbi:hypothetical protein BC835DRAFT_1268311 [Cytidiella melzeri]|nr:hypothetical protein BC835DRAFT_1268311 [Cytidiella melzeri]
MRSSFNDELLLFTANALVSLVAIYYGVEYYLGLKGKFQTERERSWVLTAVSSAVMTSCSVPYIWSWLAAGQIVDGGHWADKSSCFFIAYLLCDLMIGSMHYRSSINLLTGWIHHLVYITLITFVVIPHSFSSFFNMCCILELPTFILAMGSLNKNFRNDYLFAAVFFATRICLHIYITITCTLQALSPAGGSWAPTVFLTMIFPMHAMWMKDCVRGILRRRKQTRAKLAQSAASAASSVATPLMEPTRVRDIPAYLLARSSKRTATLLRRSRQQVLRILHDALDESASADAQPLHPSIPAAALNLTSHHLPSEIAAANANAPRWKSIRRRVVGRLRRSLPEYGASVVVLPLVPAAEVIEPVLVSD